MSAVELLGTATGILASVAFVPQVLKIWRSGTAEDISLLTFSLYSIGLLLWLLYGIALRSLPLMAVNGSTFLPHSRCWRSSCATCGRDAARSRRRERDFFRTRTWDWELS